MDLVELLESRDEEVEVLHILVIPDLGPILQSILSSVDQALVELVQQSSFHFPIHQPGQESCPLLNQK